MFRLRLQNVANSKNQLSPTAYRGLKSMTDDVENSHERTRSVTSFYYQNAIDVAAAKNSVRLSPTTMLFTGRSADNSHLLRSAQYLHKELPVRLAHRIVGFRNLPFIIGCNPTILAAHELYIRSFHILSEFPQITDAESEVKYTKMLSELVQDHKNVLNLLAEGFRECTKHIENPAPVKHFLDRTLTSRLGIRLLAEHHIGLHEEKPNYVGVICVNMSPRTLVEKKAEIVREMCELKYGHAPDVRINGHLSATFPYVAPALDYIMLELLKNAMRASIESHLDRIDNLPPIHVTIASNDIDFIIRISDRGGGIPHNLESKIWDYGFTTPEVASPNTNSEDKSIFSDLMENRASGALYGYGFGLPACRAYVEYLGGSIGVHTMQGIGTDVYVRLKHIAGQEESFRI